MTTMDKLRIDDGYVLECTDAEAERLRAQAQLMVPSSERVLRGAGLVPGMRCLDAGCGPGEGMRILGRIVGPSGHVTGLDIDAATGERMLERLRAEEGTHFAFVAGDVTHGDLIPRAPFDLVFARLLLIHMTDPVAVVRHLGALVRPAGRLVLVDYDLSRMAVRPGHPGSSAASRSSPSASGEAARRPIPVCGSASSSSRRGCRRRRAMTSSRASAPFPMWGGGSKACWLASLPPRRRSASPRRARSRSSARRHAR